MRFGDGMHLGQHQPHQIARSDRDRVGVRAAVARQQRSTDRLLDHAHAGAEHCADPRTVGDRGEIAQAAIGHDHVGRQEHHGLIGGIGRADTQPEAVRLDRIRRVAVLRVDAKLVECDRHVPGQAAVGRRGLDRRAVIRRRVYLKDVALGERQRRDVARGEQRGQAKLGKAARVFHTPYGEDEVETGAKRRPPATLGIQASPVPRLGADLTLNPPVTAMQWGRRRRSRAQARHRDGPGADKCPQSLMER